MQPAGTQFFMPEPTQLSQATDKPLLLHHVNLLAAVIPFVWVAGIVFTFPVALAIVMAGSAVGMALQYLLARYILHDRVERFVNNSPKRHGLSVTLRAVELAGPWRVVALLRLGPFPYHLLNYALVSLDDHTPSHSGSCTVITPITDT